MLSIDTKLVKLNKLVKSLPHYLANSLFVPVLLVIGGLFLQIALDADRARAEVFLGGPVSYGLEDQEQALLVSGSLPPDLSASVSDQDVSGFFFFDQASLLEPGNPIAQELPGRDGLIIYKVKEGDTLSAIAAQFGISLNTIIWANGEVKASVISPGQEIVILPISGVLHKVKEGDTLELVSGLYGVSAEQILKYNKALLPGQPITREVVVVPGARPQSQINPSGSDLPTYPNYFVMPTTGWNWGRLHGKNGVDIANACGTQVFASASGLVAQGTGHGYNGGYGNRVIIEHPNSAKTLYAHLNKILVSVGDYVSQGDLIALMGNTGNVHGPTGCHLHFEVWGAKNEFAK